jgi:Fe-S oxidoreductase
VGVNSTGYVEFDLGFVEQARAAAAETATLLVGLGDQPLVSINPFTVAAFRLYAKELGLPLVSRVYTLVEFLATFGCPPVKRPIEGIGVYHDPGVLARDLGVVREPRSLLGAIGLELREAATYGENAADDGAHVGYPWSDVNERIALGRAEELLTTGARLVITASPWSLHNLSAVCGSVPVLDISEVLALASDLCSGRGVIG